LYGAPSEGFRAGPPGRQMGLRANPRVALRPALTPGLLHPGLSSIRP